MRVCSVWATMKEWILLWMVVALVAGDYSPEDGHHERVRRVASSHTDTFTIQNLIQLVEKIEQSSDWNFDQTTNALREKGYPRWSFDVLCFKDGRNNLPGINTKELKQLEMMIQHRDDRGQEKGVIRTKEGDTVAFGHVLTGICTGTRRSFNFLFSGLDNLHAATLAGDLGQTCLLTGCALGTTGTWDDITYPMNYTLNGSSNEATKAEIMGDIHGFILGIIVPQIVKPLTTLSDYLHDFYLGPGLGPNGKFKASRSIQLFKEAVSVERLTIETRVFNTVYAKRKFWKWSPSSDADIERVVRNFFQLDFVTPCSGFPETHKITYIISLVEELERQSGNPGLDDMLEHLKAPQKEGFEWYIASEIMQGYMNHDTQLESGVFVDNSGTTLLFGHVLLDLNPYHASSGVLSGYLRRMMTYIAHYYTPHKQIVVGKPGAWEGSCPKQHRTSKPGLITHAMFIGAVDGVVLASALNQYIKDNPSAKLSTMLDQYYGAGLAKQPNVRSSKRFEQVEKVLTEGKTQTLTNDNTECYAMLPEILEKSCNEVAIYTYTTSFYQIRTIQNCGDVAKKVCNTFTQTVRQELKAASNVDCKYGDIMKLKPKGASERTGGHYGAGVSASDAIMKSQMSRANKYKDCFVSAGKATNMQPALIAALASRGSRLYDEDDRTLLNIDGTSAAKGNDGYGMMQCDPSSRIDCRKYGPDSCEHVQQVIEEILVPNAKGVREKLPFWEDEQQLQGAVAAYNFNLSNVKVWDELDKWTSGNDYSGDVIARAQYLICQQGWKYCGESCPQKRGSLPPQSLLQQMYPYLLGDADLRTRFARAAEPAADALRMCVMFNNIPGHELDHRITTSSIAPDGNVYYGESHKLREYLNARYGNAECASSITAFHGKPGILFAEDASSNHGVMGLWDGRQVFHMDDFSGQGSQLCLWSTGKDCRLMAESGDCEFYVQCVEQRLKCGEEGYPRGYGHKFCEKFSEYYDEFTDRGKKWVDDVRVCLMKALLPFMANPGLTCSQLNEIAFKSHAKCYVDNGFCEVIVSTDNVKALYRVVGLRQFVGPNWIFALQQVGGVISRCVGVVAAITAEKVAEYIDAAFDKIKDLISPVSQEAIGDECVGYATAGDCKFYECFEARHKCKKQNGVSYLLQFELPSCLEFKHKAVGFTLSGKSWLASYQQCVMSKLLPLYRADTVNCEQIGLVLKQHRASCVVEAGFCGMINDTPNEWFIDRATYDNGYPLIQRYRSFTYPLSKTPDVTTNFYYRELDHLKWDIGYARKTCTGSLTSGPEMYSIIYSKKTHMNMKVENKGFY